MSSPNFVNRSKGQVAVPIISMSDAKSVLQNEKLVNRFGASIDVYDSIF